MDYEQAIKYIEDSSWSASRLGLERTRELLRLMGDPQKSLRFVHVTGSNGKGSTCAMIASMLTAAGYRTGFYSSPHLISFNERIRVDGQYIPDGRLAEITGAIKPLADSMDDHPSQFELSTAVAIKYFADEKCDIAVLEVGMGGESDSTNIIENPEAAVITNIGLEHTEYLGDTVEKIALTKSGIIKSGCPCVSYEMPEKVMQVIREKCASLSAPLHAASFADIEPLSRDLDGQSFRFEGKKYSVPLLGRHQLNNAAVALTTVRVLRERGFDISDRAAASGLSAVNWPARFNVMMKDPVFILDAGHNPQCAETLAASLRDYLPAEKVCFILGFLADKDAGKMLDILLPFASRVICVTPDSPRALKCEDLSHLVSLRGIKTDCAASAAAAAAAAFEDDPGTMPVVAFGSLYMAASLLRDWRRAVKAALRLRGKEARKNLTADERRLKSKEIVSRIVSLDAFAKAHTVMIYSAMRSEVDLSSITKIAPDKTYVYPRCISETEMIAVKPADDNAWSRSSLGIMEPALDNNITDPSQIDMAICPLTAFDTKGNRLGMGAGYYDRFLTKLRKGAHITGVAFDVQMVPEIPCEETDFRPDDIITESKK